MLRTVLGAILGYIVMFAIVAGGLTGAYLAMGSDRAFQAGTYEVTGLWLVTMFAVGLVAAALGGLACYKVARSRGGVIGLIGIVVVMGGLSAAAAGMAAEPPPEEQIRTGDTPNFEAMTKAQTPLWVALLNPVVGVVGVMVGAKLGGCGGGKSEASTE